MSQDLSQTFSQGGLTFNYPGDWNDTRYNKDENISGGSVVQPMGLLISPKNITLHVDRANVSGAGYSIESLKENAKSGLKNDGYQILSDTRTTVNGVVVCELLANKKDSALNKDLKGLYVVTSKDEKVVYYLAFSAETSIFDNNRQLMDNIINTIQIQ